MSAYQWLVCYMLKRTYEKLNSQVQAGKPAFWAKNDSQVYYAKTLGIVYIQVRIHPCYYPFASQ